MVRYNIPTMNLETIRAAVALADAAVFKLINTGLGCKPLDLPMLLATWAGVGIVQSGISILFILVGTFWDRLSLRRAGYAGLIAFAASGIGVQIAKHLWDRPRPLLAMHDVRVVGEPLFAHAFPSGHAMTAFAVLVAWAIIMPSWRKALLAVGVATAFSRVYLGAHFPLDVIYGAIIGAFVGRASAGLLPDVKSTRHPGLVSRSPGNAETSSA